MQSRLLATLEADARTSLDRDVWARAVCRIAAHYARQGHTDLALEAIGRVRKEFGATPSPAAKTWLMFADGVFHFFHDRWDEGAVAMRSAYNLAFSERASLARPTCAAWLAHMDFNLLRFEDMAKHLEEALTLARIDDHQALARASLVLADALHYAGDFQLARPWYVKVRIHGSAEGDEATLSALLHNVAAFRAGNVRMSDTFSTASPQEAKQALMQANSAWNFDTAIGTASFQSLVPLLQGQLLAVHRDFLSAERMLTTIDPGALERKSLPLLWVDLAWCLASQGRHDEASIHAAKAASLLDMSTDIDEVAYINSRLAQVADIGGDASGAMRYKGVALEALTKHASIQASLRELLIPIAKLNV